MATNRLTNIRCVRLIERETGIVHREFFRAERLARRGQVRRHPVGGAAPVTQRGPEVATLQRPACADDPGTAWIGCDPQDPAASPPFAWDDDPFNYGDDHCPPASDDRRLTFEDTQYSFELDIPFGSSTGDGSGAPTGACVDFL